MIKWLSIIHVIFQLWPGRISLKKQVESKSLFAVIQWTDLHLLNEDYKRSVEGGESGQVEHICDTSRIELHFDGQWTSGSPSSL